MQQELQAKKRKLIHLLLDKNILVEPEFLEKINKTTDTKEISELINSKLSSSQATEQINPNLSIEKTEKAKRNGKVKIVFSFDNKPKPIIAQDFITYFNSRYNAIKKILQQRTQLENISSIGKLKTKNEREQVSLIGLVYNKEETKNGIMLTVEDQTGQIKVYFGNTKQALFAKAKDIVLDEVIGITGSTGKNIVFGNEIYFPDIPITKEFKKSPSEEYAVFASDLHIGAKDFLEDDFLKFIHWLQGNVGNEQQKEISSKVKYVFMTGDVVDGVSIYPTQKEELSIHTFKEQYKKFAEYLRMIPNDIQIIICPGNHDVVQISEPQPVLPREYCEDLFTLSNVTLVSNPAVVNIAAKEGFPGFDVLMYHGYSYNHYADDVESIRIQKPNISERAELVMKLLLQKRHLGPTYDGNPHTPTEVDHLVIEQVPDIFVSGDVHRSAAFTYKGVITGIIGSCFQPQTSFQEKVGHIPDPGRIPVLNLKTRDVKILNFRSGDKDE